MNRDLTSQVDGGLAGVADRCALATAAIGLMVLAGWVSGIEPLERVRPRLVSMKFNAALGLALALLCERVRDEMRGFLAGRITRDPSGNDVSTGG